MAGLNSGFNAAEFRAGIRFVYDMAAAPATEEQAAFYFASTLVYNSPGDAGGVPFDPNATVTRSQVPPVRVPCGVEYRDGNGQATVFGDIVPATAVITVLDEDYAKIKGCEYVVLGGEKFNHSSTQPPSGLFDVGLYTMHFASVSSR